MDQCISWYERLNVCSATYNPWTLDACVVNYETDQRTQVPLGGSTGPRRDIQYGVSMTGLAGSPEKVLEYYAVIRNFRELRRVNRKTYTRLYGIAAWQKWQTIIQARKRAGRLQQVKRYPFRSWKALRQALCLGLSTVRATHTVKQDECSNDNIYIVKPGVTQTTNNQPGTPDFR
jgi:hypothetical protein